MTPREIADRLPQPDGLRQRSLAIAALDIVIEPREGMRYFRYMPASAPAEQTAIMSNGSGDSYGIVFRPAGTVVRAFNHESHLSPWGRDDGRVAPGILAGFPDELMSVIRDPRFRLEGGPETDLTFCAWTWRRDDHWTVGTIDDDGGAADLLDVVLDGWESYRRFAQEYWDRQISAEIREFFALAPVGPEEVKRVNPERNQQEALTELRAIGYPVR